MLKRRSAIGWCVSILILIAGRAAVVIAQCYTQDQNPYRMYGTKTSYSDIMPQTQPNDQASVCRPTFIYLLARHGTRFPNQLEMQYMSQYLDAIRSNINSRTMCAQDINRLRAWMMPFQPADAERITEAGFAEMFHLGQRFQARFPHLFPAPFNPNQVHIQHTYLTRTRDSARGFASALYQRYNVSMMANPAGNDPLLRFHEICNAYIQNVGSPRVQAYDEFINSQVFSQLVNDVAARLGIPVNAFTKDHMKIAWEACRYEHSILKNAPWCAIFTPLHLQAMEYATDMKDFYKRGYGNQINADMTCSLMKDIIQNLRAATSGRQSRVAALRFGHADTIQPLFARLGLFCDQMAPNGNNWQSNTNRQWRTSRISSFASNIAFLIYDCSGTPHLRVLVNEQPVIMPGCTDQLCPIATALGRVGQWAEQCNFQQICGPVGGQNYDPNMAMSPYPNNNPLSGNDPNQQIQYPQNPIGVGVNQYSTHQCPTNNMVMNNGGINPIGNTFVNTNPLINNPNTMQRTFPVNNQVFSDEFNSGQRLGYKLLPVCLVTLLITRALRDLICRTSI